MTMLADDCWWKTQKGNVHEKTTDYVRRIEQELGDIFERIFLLECLYDPNSPEADGNKKDRVTENAIASNVDTVSAIVASTDIRARFMTDGGDWQQQRRARHLEWYAEELQTRFGVLPKCRRAFKESAKKGNGLVKVHNVLGSPRVEHILVENIVVPPDETRDGRMPTQLHHWDYIDADELVQRFPAKKAAIERARSNGTRRRMQWGGRTNFLANDVECLWSYRLPIGTKGKKGYKAGRVTLVIDGEDLLDEKYEKEIDGVGYFPFAMMVWTERVTSFYGISGAERIMGIQRALNRRHWQIESANDKVAQPTTYVRPADANLAAKSHRVGAVVVVRGDYPKTEQHQAVNAETYQDRQQLSGLAGEEFGQTRMVTHGAKPPGLDSGIALREFTDQTSQRFASQEEGFETDLVLQTNFLVIDCCKDLGKDAPVVMRRSRFGARKLAFRDVDMGEVKVQMKAAANLNRSPAGRQQLVIEFAQAGIISTDQARRLLPHPDLESELSLYTAALEDVERTLDEIADGRIVMPEPFTNLEMACWRGQNEYLKWVGDGAPEEILESLRQYVVQAAWMITRRNRPTANDNAAGMPMDAAVAAPPSAGNVGMPPMPGAPAPGSPSAAFSSQAMNLRAS